MPLRTVRLTPEEQQYVIDNVDSGRFGNAAELVKAALNALIREEQARRERIAKDAYIQSAVDSHCLQHLDLRFDLDQHVIRQRDTVWDLTPQD